MKKDSEEKLVKELKAHIHRITDDIKDDVKRQVAGDVKKKQVVDDVREKQVAGDVKEKPGRSAITSIKQNRIYLALALSLASIGLGIAIAAIAGLIS